MTSKQNKSKKAELNRYRENILRALQSIDTNVEDILDTLNERFEADLYYPPWNSDEYQLDSDY